MAPREQAARPWLFYLNCAPEGALLAHVGQQRHEAGAFDGVLDGALERGAIAAALAAEQLALAGAKLFEALHVLVIHEDGAWAALLGAKPAAILSASAEFLANHRNLTLGLNGANAHGKSLL